MPKRKEPAGAVSVAEMQETLQAPQESIAEPSAVAAASTETAHDETDARPSLGDLIRSYRLKRGLTQLQLSQAMGHRTPEWTGMIEAGQRALDLDKVPQLANVLQINAQDLVQLTMFEYFPRAAEALWQAAPDAGGLREDNRPKQIRLQPETLEIAHNYDRLPPNFQRVVMSLINNLLDLNSHGVRDRDARPIPVRRRPS